MSAIWMTTSLAPLQAQTVPDVEPPSSRAVRQASFSSDKGIVAARLDATRASQIRVTVTFMMVDDETRANIYKQIGHESIKTSLSKIAEGPSRGIVSDSISSASASKVVGTTSHVSTCVLEKTNRDRILAMVDQAPSSRFGKTPSILLLDGRDAEFSDIVQRPFVVDIERIEGGLNPVVKAFDEGTRFHIHASMADTSVDAPRRIKLKSEISWLKILDVQGRKIFGVDKESTSIQVPEHSVKTVSIAQELAAGQSLLVDPYIEQSVTHENEAGVPILTKVPYLSRTFKNTSRATVKENIMVLLQPDVE